MSICNVVLHRLFPNSDLVIKNEIQKLEQDIVALYKDLNEEQSTANEMKQILDKLNNKNIAMDPNGMSRDTAIKTTRQRLSMVLKKIKNINLQLSMFETYRYNMENNKMTLDMKRKIKSIHSRLGTTAAIDIDKLEDDIDDIHDFNADVTEINNAVSRTMLSGWDVDMEQNEKELEAFLLDGSDHSPPVLNNIHEPYTPAPPVVSAPAPASPPPAPVVPMTRENLVEIDPF